MSKFIKRMMADENGASATEYAILLAMVGAAVAGLGLTFSTGLTGVYTQLVTKMSGWLDSF